MATKKVKQKDPERPDNHTKHRHWHKGGIKVKKKQDYWHKKDIKKKE
jgi:hypothetical protein